MPEHTRAVLVGAELTAEQTSARVSSGQGKVREIPDLAKVRETGILLKVREKMNIGKSQGKVREFAFSAI